MSTRCNIKIITITNDDISEKYLYHHCDGYPAGVGTELTTKIIPEFIKQNITNSNETLYDYIKNYDDSYEETNNIHGDIEYLYTLEYYITNQHLTRNNKINIRYKCDIVHIDYKNNEQTFENIEIIDFISDGFNKKLFNKNIIKTNIDDDRSYDYLCVYKTDRITQYSFDKDENVSINLDSNNTYKTIRDNLVKNIVLTHKEVSDETLTNELINLCDTIYNYILKHPNI